MLDFDDLQRSFFDGLYTNRIQVGFGSIVAAVILLVVAWRLRWFAAARRHPGRSSVLVVLVLAVALPLGYYTASPLWIRTALVEPDPAAAVASATPAQMSDWPSASPAPHAASVPATPAPAAFVARKIAAGPFSGTDDFHFGKGTASIVETRAGVYTLRLDGFSVRNGPDLYVYLSPEPDDYAKGALEVGKLKATDGAFGYELPAGTDPADFASAIIWCKQFSHLFAVAPLAAI